MRMWEKYKVEKTDIAPVEGVPDWLRPAIENWLTALSKKFIVKNLDMRARIVIDIKTEFRISEGSSDLFSFMYTLALNDPEMFFAVVDYIFSKFEMLLTINANNLERILEQGGHKLTVAVTDDTIFLAERLPEEERMLMGGLLSEEVVYKSEFKDAFTKIYGREPDYTIGTGEAFQALESALKFYLGEDKGNNLGAILDWLRTNRKLWIYTAPSDSQKDAEEQFIILIDFVNKSFRKTKHGQAKIKLQVKKKHAETVLRAVALLIFQLENTISLATKDA